jgi:hypothetical protein
VIPKIVTIHDLPDAHQRDSKKLLTALRQRYGEGAFLVGTQLNNLVGVMSSALNEKNSALRGDALEQARAMAQQVVSDVIAALGSAVGASPRDVQAVTEALSEFAQQYENDVLGERGLETTEGAAKDLLAKVGAAEAARLVLVSGVRPSEAARLCGVRYRQQVYRAVNCIRRAAIIGDVCSVCGGHVGGNERGAAALAEQQVQQQKLHQKET